MMTKRKKMITYNSNKGPLHAGVVWYATDAKHVHGQLFSVAPTYDPDGNMTSDGIWSYDWDAENRLIEVQPLVTNLGSTLVQYMYDAQSRRIARREFAWMAFLHDDPAWRYVQGRAYRYDDWNLLLELKPATTPRTPPTYIPQTDLALTGIDGSVAAAYVWGLDLSATLQDAGGIGGLLMQRHSDPNSPWFSFCDANGNISDLLYEDGTLAAHYEYDSYGNTAVQFGTSSVTNPYRFSSKYNDYGGAGLYYYGYRFYSSKMGKWLSRDSLLELSFQMLLRQTYQASNMFYEDDGISPYIFAFDNPIDGFDVLGLDSRNIPCGNCLICVDKNRSGDGQSPFHIHWNCGSHRRPHSCRGGDSADWPSGKGREGSPDVPNNIRKCLKNTNWRFEPVEVSVPAPGDCCQNEMIDEAVYVGTAVGTCVVAYALYKVFKTCLGGVVGFLVAGPPGAVGSVSFCLATP